jgi:hypothetical protein
MNLTGWANWRHACLPETHNGSSLAAVIQRGNLALLDPDSLKPRKLIPCNCIDFDWSPAKKELAATAPSNIIVFSESGQKREIHTTFDGNSPILWTDESHLLTAFSDSAVVLRDARTSKIVKTFAFPSDKKTASGAGR